LVGSFYQPRLVLTDPGVLKTLPERIFSDGMAEVIKYGCIYDASLFDQLLSLDKENLEEDLEGIIETCARIKKEVTEKDEMESGLRKILNFGHTLGHVIETYFNYQKYSHGEAVAIGMHYITQQSERKGITREGTADKIRDILIKYNLPYKMPDLEKNKVLEILARDKKFSGDKISLVLLKSIGQVTLVGFDKNQLTEFIL
ncbi:MAG: 3-dehydroquinate synthase, partial [Eubacteriaceae bacterium]|nr:3-dehydroquinate synthase [Eubacteriaceae bacterium]